MSDLDDLRSLARRIPQARQRMLENLPGYGTHADGPSSGHGDRTVSLALKATMATDPAVRDLQALLELETELQRRVRERVSFVREMGRLKVILDRWAPTERMTDGLRATGNESGDGWCQSHWRVGSCHPPRTQGSRLCRWCEDWVRALNDPAGEWAMAVELPPLGMVELHAQGRRVDAALPPRKKSTR